MFVDSSGQRDKFHSMGQGSYYAQRVEILRCLAASMSDQQTRHVILTLADQCERRAQDKAAALKAIKDRVGAQ